MKEKLTDNRINSFVWIETKKMVADLLTKKKLDMLDMDNIVLRNKYEGLVEKKIQGNCWRPGDKNEDSDKLKFSQWIVNSLYLYVPMSICLNSCS